MSTIEHHSDAGHSHESHALPPELVAHQQRRSMILFIIADAVFFACLLLTYFYLRALNVDGLAAYFLDFDRQLHHGVLRRITV